MNNNLLNQLNNSNIIKDVNNINDKLIKNNSHLQISLDVENGKYKENILLELNLQKLKNKKDIAIKVAECYDRVSRNKSNFNLTDYEITFDNR